MKSVSVDLPVAYVPTPQRASAQPAAVRPRVLLQVLVQPAVLVCCAASVLCAVVSFPRLQSRLQGRQQPRQQGAQRAARPARVEREEGASAGRLQGPAARAGGRADADKRAGRARGASARGERPCRARRAGRASRARDARSEGASRAGRSAESTLARRRRRATSEKRRRGTRRVDRRWQRRVRCSEDFSGDGRLKQRSGRQR